MLLNFDELLVFLLEIKFIIWSPGNINFNVVYSIECLKSYKLTFNATND